METTKTTQAVSSPATSGERSFEGYTMNGFLALFIILALILAVGGWLILSIIA